MKLTDSQMSLLQTALRCAAEVFDKDAADCKADNPPAGIKQLADQFEKQAKETRELADMFNTADSIEVIGE